MSYIALYRKWRPLVFQDVVEQEHVVQTLKNSVKTGRIAHAYLFCGTRGTGKTTMAHILSRAINCLNPKDGDPCNKCEICTSILSGTLLDVVEIDAASNNSVDNVREIRDEVVYAPSRAKYKVYIIDEVHMLSTGAFNALLKTLEEPPQHVVFILATTEPHKLPATILSRCQRFDFRRITLDSIMKRLMVIAEDNNLVLHKDAARLIARLSDGALRDAISLLDQCISIGNKEINYSLVMSVVGIAADTFISDIIDCIIDKNVEKLLASLDNLVQEGLDISRFVSDLISYYRNILICSVSDNPEDIVETYPEALEKLKKQSNNYSVNEISAIIKELSSLEGRLKWANNPRIMLEVSLIKICRGLDYTYGSESTFSNMPNENLQSGSNDKSDVLLRRISELEKKVEELSVKLRSEKLPYDQHDTHGMQGNTPEKTVPLKSNGNNSNKKPASKANDKEVNDKEILNSGHGSGTSENISEMWSRIIKELFSLGRVMLYTHLLDTKAVKLDSNTIGIVFPQDKSSLKDVVNTQENLQVIRGLLSNFFEKEIKIKLLDQDYYEEKLENKENHEQKDQYHEKAKEISEKLKIPIDKINLIDG